MIIDSESLKEINYWYFSTLAQFNGAILGLTLAALGISYILHSDKTIFLFKKGEFELLRITLYLFILNAIFAFFFLVFMKRDYMVLVLPLTLVIETLGLILLGAFFGKSISIFGSKIPFELKKIEIEKIIQNINLELKSDTDKYELVLENKIQSFFDIEGLIFPRFYEKMSGPGFFNFNKNVKLLNPINIKKISEVKENNKILLWDIGKVDPEEVLTGLKLFRYILEFEMLLKFRDKLQRILKNPLFEPTKLICN